MKLTANQSIMVRDEWGDHEGVVVNDQDVNAPDDVVYYLRILQTEPTVLGQRTKALWRDVVPKPMDRMIDDSVYAPKKWVSVPWPHRPELSRRPTTEMPEIHIAAQSNALRAFRETARYLRQRIRQILSVPQWLDIDELPDVYRSDMERMGWPADAEAKLDDAEVQFQRHGNFTVALLVEDNQDRDIHVGIAKRNAKADPDIPERAERIALCRAVRDWVYRKGEV